MFNDKMKKTKCIFTVFGIILISLSWTPTARAALGVKDQQQVFVASPLDGPCYTEDSNYYLPREEDDALGEAESLALGKCTYDGADCEIVHSFILRGRGGGSDSYSIYGRATACPK